MSALIELFPQNAERLGWAVIHSLWQGAIAVAALGFVLRLLRHRSAAARHAACLVTLLAMLAAAVATTLSISPRTVPRHLPRVAPQIRAMMPPSAAAIAASVVPSGDAAAPPDDHDSARVSATMRPMAAHRPWREQLASLLPWIASAWLFGVLALSLRHCGGWWRVRALRQRGRIARPEWQQTCARLAERFGVRGGVRLLESADSAGPMLAGLFKPVVLVPARLATGLSAAELEAILAHELAHLARHDAWSNFAQLAIETLFFYHPAVWWIGHRARQEREHAADDLALRVCTDRRLYAGALTRLAELQILPSPALAATGGNLLARIHRIVRPEAVETAPGGWSLALVAPLIVALAGALWIARVNANEAKTTTPAPNAAAPAETAQQASERAMKTAKPWIDDAFQLDDAAKRAAAIERIRAAMNSADADEAHAGVTAFVRLGPVEFDKASFRPAVRSLLGSADAATRAAAASAITMVGAEAEDIERVLALADDPSPEVREHLSWIILQLHNRDLTGRGGEAVLKLLAGHDHRMLREALRGIWGGKFSPELEARVIELSRDFETTSSVGYDAMYFALSTQANKSEASVKRLLELLAHQDTGNVAGRCAWGLQQGVARAQYPLVAEAMMKVIESRSDGYLRGEALRCLRAYGSTEQSPAIRALLAKPGVSGEFRKLLEETAASLEPRAVAQAAPPVAPADAPPAPNAPPAAQGVVQIATDGATKWNGQDLSLEALGAELKARVKQSAEFAVIVRAAKEADYKSVLKILDLCREANVQKVAFAANAAADAPAADGQRAAKFVETNRQAARLRAAQDQRHYNAEQLREIETLYQVANKNWRSEEARASLKELLAKYDNANRTGCATLYMGQMSEGQERLDYLTRAVEKFSDCYYFDGCQVGGYGRYVLALTLWEKGDKDKTRALLAELKTKYKDATDHRGRPMGEIAEAAEKELAAKE